METCFNAVLGRSPGEGKVYPFQYSDLENSMDSTVHGLTKIGHNWATFTCILPDDSLRFFPPFRLKTILVEQHLWSFLFLFFWHISPPSFQIASFPIKTTFHSANICSQVVTSEQWTAESEFSNSDKETPDYRFIDPSCFLHALSENNNNNNKIVTSLK